jgi:hypothetical protein
MTVELDTYALVTLDEAKNYLMEDPVADLDREEDLINRLINGISAAAETYMNRKIIARDYTEDQDGSGTDSMQLRQYPIVSLTSVCVDWERNFPVGLNIALSDIIIYSEEGKIVRSPSGLNIYIDEETGKIVKYSTFARGKKNVRTIYNAGYATVPHDIKHVVLQEIVWHYENTTKKKLGVQAVAAVGENVSVFIGELLPTTKMVLSAYRKLL